MTTISISKATNGEIKKFSHKEWKKQDIKHYGPAIKWVEKDFILKAMEGRKIVGCAKFKYECGVIYIKNLIVVEDERRNSIGKKIMEQIEKIAKKMRAHKIYLFTGKKWGVSGFYEKLRYKKNCRFAKAFFQG